GNGLQKYYWVPNAHTDAIFAIIGEELGFVGCLGVLLLFGILSWRGFRIAWKAQDPFARLFATGLTCMLTLQALVNIAVITNSLPYTGVTLPLVSFGGSSTVISLIAIGLLLNISRQPVTVAEVDSEIDADDPRSPAPRYGEAIPTTRPSTAEPRRHVAVQAAPARLRPLARRPRSTRRV
ncbi:MAG: FtsW/RodA/SpoVE family cell cycle protein, partial [Chloroflexi bacterium]|nr:FtsW/RodA/SpoVE family cell cycle protein [Chloroflexota bacterium]